jgi:amino acid transporter
VIFAVAGCILGLSAAHLTAQPQRKRAKPTKATAVLATALLIIGALLALMTWVEGTSASGAIMLFYVLGGVGYILLLRAVSSPKQNKRGYRCTGALVLCLMASWSWTSAISMYAHRGATEHADTACILVPNPSDYNTELNSIWEMRLPQVRSQRTSPSGSYIWEYHAILVAQTDGRTEHYNWSKKWMRFERLDPVRNPYLPKTCP